MKKLLLQFLVLILENGKIHPLKTKLYVFFNIGIVV